MKCWATGSRGEEPRAAAGPPAGLAGMTVLASAAVLLIYNPVALTVV